MPARSSAQLRRELVKELEGKGVLESAAVRRALLAVPRERFLPALLAEQGLEAVYRDEAIVTKRDARGMPLSSSSQPALMARMLELLDVLPGHRVLEVGAGTGYNAALLAELVGPSGRVTTVDVDPDLARAAQRALDETGHAVSVRVGDGRAGWTAGAPYDRIVATACADELPRAWLEQLAEGGLLELPLRLDRDRTAIQVIPVFQRHGERLRSIAFTWGSFMPLHDGDGGWRAPPVQISASRSGATRHLSLANLTGPVLAGLSRRRTSMLLASLLSVAARPLDTGTTSLASAQPPLLLIYLLLSVPASRRVAMHGDDRIGVGIFDRLTGSLALVSLRNPWTASSASPSARVRWRLDAYGGAGAATELRRVLDEWREMERAKRTRLWITASGHRDPLRLRFEWSADGRP